MFIWGMSVVGFLLIMGSQQTGQSVDAELRSDVHHLVCRYLDACNAREGIELVGGPFPLEHYTVVIEDAGANVRYLYKRPEAIEGCPDSISVHLFGDGRPFLEQINPAWLCRTEEFTCCGDLSEHDIEEILGALKQVARAGPITQFSKRASLICIERDGQITRKPFLPACVDSMRRTEDTVEVVLNNWTDALAVQESVGTATGALYLWPLADGSWGAEGSPWPRIGCTEKRATAQRFLLFGELDDSQIKAVVQGACRASGESSVYAMDAGVTPNGGASPQCHAVMYVRVLMGNRRLNLPSRSVRLQRTHLGWQVGRMAVVQNPEMEFQFGGGDPFSFRPPERPSLVDAFLRNLRVQDVDSSADGHANQRDLQEIVSAFVRIRGVADEEGIHVTRFSSTHVRIMTGGTDFPYGTRVELKKVRGRWAIVHVRQN